jgi:predicted nuclease of predicted toxin-antitoxin system
VRFVFDAQLPPRLAKLLITKGYDAIHVESLLGGTTSADSEIAAIADAEDRVVVTRGSDFRHSHPVAGSPIRRH